MEHTTYKSYELKVKQLLSELESLRDENDDLKNQLRENTVIDSMNQMKDTYESLETEFERLKNELEDSTEKYETCQRDASYLRKDVNLLVTINTAILQIVNLDSTKLSCTLSYLDNMTKSADDVNSRFLIADLKYLKSQLKILQSYQKTCQDLLETLPQRLLRYDFARD